jgi:hypothetical protein
MAAEATTGEAYDAAAGEGQILPADGSVNLGNARQFADHAQPARAAAAGIAPRQQRKLDALARQRPDLEPPLEPLPDRVERPFRTPPIGKGAEDPAKAALLASVSRLPWETASP